MTREHLVATLHRLDEPDRYRRFPAPQFQNENTAKAFLENLLRPWFLLKREVWLKYPGTDNTLRIDYLAKPRAATVDFPHPLFGVECKPANQDGGCFNRAVKQAIDYTHCLIADPRNSLAAVKGQRLEQVYLFPAPPCLHGYQSDYSHGWHAGAERLGGLFHVGLIYLQQIGVPHVRYPDVGSSPRGGRGHGSQTPAGRQRHSPPRASGGLGMSADRIELTLFRKREGPLTKRISLGPDGSIVSDAAQCVMPRGTAQRFTFSASSIQEFADRTSSLSPSEAWALGSLRPDLPDEVQVVTKRTLNGSNDPSIIARSQDFLVYRQGEPGLDLIDFDTKGMPAVVAQRIQESGGFWPALVSVIPEIENVGRIERTSTSAAIYDARTGKNFPGSGGYHVYPLIKDSADAERFLKVLHARCWLAGLGWIMVGRAGQFLERSIVDRVCGAPERLAFEGPPDLASPLAQDEAARRPTVFEGPPLDTRAACPPLSVVDYARLQELRFKDKHRLAGEAAKARQLFIDQQSRRIAARTGVDLNRARKTIERLCVGVLLPDVELEFDDPELAGKTVADVMADPARFEGETLADPHEGIEYGRGKAQIMWRADGSVWIHSFAHGLSTYELRLDFAAAKAVLEKTSKDDATDQLVRLALAADLRENEIEQLKHIAADRSKIGVAALQRTLKAARQEQAAGKAQEQRERRAAERLDPRPQLDEPPADAEYGPQMTTLNTVIGQDKSAEPTTRNPNKVIAVARKIRVPSLHALTTMETNLDDDPDEPTARPRTTGLKAAE